MSVFSPRLMTAPKEFMSTTEVCAAVGCCAPTLARMVKDRGFPPPVPHQDGFGHRRFWRTVDVLKALAGT
jgi:predicted DNA-binding transcriptional regulator AlpA